MAKMALFHAALDINNGFVEFMAMLGGRRAEFDSTSAQLIHPEHFYTHYRPVFIYNYTHDKPPNIKTCFTMLIIVTPGFFLGYIIIQ
jgi:hypothetical protein